MTDEEMLTELRAIRALLAFEKREELEELVDDLTGIQRDIVDELATDEWREIPTSDIADDHDVSGQTVRNHRDDLLEDDLIAERGSNSNKEYRIKGLMVAIERLPDRGE